jgi:hypothetical protein
MAKFARLTSVPAAFVLMMFAASSGAGEIGAFVTMPTPRADWNTGFGFHAAVISLPFLQAGGEYARMGGDDPLVSISTYTAQAELNPPSIKISPFIGLGVGAYHQSYGTQGDWGTLTTIFGGLRVPIGVARLRAEVRKVSLSGTPRVNMDKRFSLGVSFRF